jgi:hypothetical protein
VVRAIVLRLDIVDLRLIVAGVLAFGVFSIDFDGVFVDCLGISSIDESDSALIK